MLVRMMLVRMMLVRTLYLIAQNYFYPSLSPFPKRFPVVRKGA